MENKIPLVSVIIPMFNAAKFIPQTLESLLYQTMTDFEVVVVDDCSNDNSVEVVESFSERFGGRLKLVKLPKNTGSPGIPRNVGIQIACGKYISFLDSDDLYTKTALEELSTLAEKFQADVVSVDGSFRLWGGNQKSVDAPEMTDMNELTNPKNFTVKRFFCDSSLNEPTLKPETFEGRVKLFIDAPAYNFGIFSSFCRRNFLIVNQIKFPDMFAGEDQFFNFACLCLAKNFLRIPNIFYIVRPRANSIMRELSFNPEQYFRKRVNAFIHSLIEAEKFMKDIPFFQKHLNYRYAVLDKFAFLRLDPTHKFYLNSSRGALNTIVKKEFNFHDAVASAYLFDMVNIYKIYLARLQLENNALKEELKKYRSAKTS